MDRLAAGSSSMLARFPATPASDLPLFPRDYTNPTGTGTYNEGTFTGTHRKWVDSIAGKLVPTVTGRDGQPREQVFDRLAVFPYAYRHSYAQRHADASTPRLRAQGPMAHRPTCHHPGLRQLSGIASDGRETAGRLMIGGRDGGMPTAGGCLLTCVSCELIPLGA